MLVAILRIAVGYVLACMLAGLVLVMHVVTPAELAVLSGEQLADRVVDLGSLANSAATYIAFFALPFALIVAAIGEWFSLRGMVYYIVAGLAIATAGFLAQQASETPGQTTIVNAFAIQAFVLTGLVAGLVYWLLAGRYAGGSPATKPFKRAPLPPTTTGDAEAPQAAKPGSTEA